MSDHEELLTFPFAIMLVIAFMGIVSGNTIFSGMDMASVEVILAALVLAVIAIGIAGGTTALTVGLNGASISLYAQTAMIAAVWAGLTATTANFLLLNGSIGGMIYAVLTIIYIIGTVLHIRGLGT